MSAALRSYKASVATRTLASDALAAQRTELLLQADDAYLARAAAEFGVYVALHLDVNYGDVVVTRSYVMHELVGSAALTPAHNLCRSAHIRMQCVQV